jgi:hypothetical protein
MTVTPLTKTSDASHSSHVVSLARSQSSSPAAYAGTVRRYASTILELVEA